MTYLTVSLAKSHRKKEFSCGVDLLDIYLHKQAGQDIRRKLAACFVLEDQPGSIGAYYTLSNTGIPLDSVPESHRKNLPGSYSAIPATLIGRLAVDKKYQGKGKGKLMLVDALKRSYEASLKIGSFAVVVDPINQDAEEFYSTFGFIKLPDSGKMFLPMKTVEKLFV